MASITSSAGVRGHQWAWTPGSLEENLNLFRNGTPNLPLWSLARPSWTRPGPVGGLSSQVLSVQKL